MKVVGFSLFLMIHALPIPPSAGEQQIDGIKQLFCLLQMNRIEQFLNKCGI